MIIEDDPYRRIRFSGAPIPPIKTFDTTDRVIGVGTMAKILSPGLKVGWVNAAPAIVKRLGAIKMDGGSSPFAQRMVALLIENGRLSEIIATIAAEMRVHRDALTTSFARRLPEAKFLVPNGGYFLWVEMPQDVDCDVLARLAAAEGVSVFSGTHCFANDPRRNFLRLSYSFCTPPELDESVARLVRAYAKLPPAQHEEALA
jgi:2-aminoadipate transaminase